MLNRNILFILSLMVSFNVLAQDSEAVTPSKKSENSKLVCNFPTARQAFWTEDRGIYGWQGNKAYDQLRIFQLPIEPQSVLREETQLYYLTQTSQLGSVLADRYKPAPYQYFFISELTPYDQERLAEYVEKNCNLALDFERTAKTLANIKAKAGQQLNPSQRLPLDVDRMFETMHDTATTAETASK